MNNAEEFEIPVEEGQVRSEMRPFPAELHFSNYFKGYVRSYVKYGLKQCALLATILTIFLSARATWIVPSLGAALWIFSAFLLAISLYSLNYILKYHETRSSFHARASEHSSQWVFDDKFVWHKCDDGDFQRLTINDVRVAFCEDYFMVKTYGRIFYLSYEDFEGDNVKERLVKLFPRNCIRPLNWFGEMK